MAPLRRVFLLALIAGAGLSAQERPGGQTFKARLSPTPLDVAMQSTVAGRGSVTAVLEGNRLVLTGTYEGLKSPATVARLHRGYRGVRGPSFAELKVSGGTSGTISGTVDLTPSQAAEAGRSLFYVQLHSEKAPEGNLWGWLLPAEGKTK